MRRIVGGHDANTPTTRVWFSRGRVVGGVSIVGGGSLLAALCCTPPPPVDPPPPPPAPTMGTSTTGDPIPPPDPGPVQPLPPSVPCDAVRDSARTERAAKREVPPPRIVEGETVPYEQYIAGRYKFAVSLQYQVGAEWRHYCGGSVAISQNLVTTAAHCQPSRFDRVVVGRHDLRSNEGETYTIRDVWTHAQWNKPSQHNNDFALILLTRPTTVEPVELEVEPRAWPYVTAVGWGAVSEGGPLSPTLQFVDVQLHGDSTCDNSLLWTPRMGCAGTGQGDGCQGDSGGFYGVMTGAGRFLQVGATSWGYGCNRPNHPGYFAYYAGDGAHGAGWTHACAREAEAM